jgi:hypothetical protein
MSELEKLKWIRDRFSAALNDASEDIQDVLDYCHEARRVSALKFNMKMGIEGDLESVAFYAFHDKDCDRWRKAHLKDGIKAIDKRLRALERSAPK